MERSLPRMVRTEEQGEGPGDRTWQTELQQSQQPGQYFLHFEAAQDKSVPSP